ncbi:hydrolase [Peribacillus cavernae]|nr:hydrolase [Peribacillus cavernae]
MKNTYYIYLANGQISQDRESSEWNFKIEATDEEITQLREYFDQNYSTEIENFYRAHVPYVQYHYDRENDAYDETIQRIYGMIYELGDEEAKNHIESMGILHSKPTTDGFSQ